MLTPTWANQCTDGCIGCVTLRELAYGFLRLAIGVMFSFLFCFLICLHCFSLSFLFLLLVFFFTNRLVPHETVYGFLDKQGEIQEELL